MAASDITNVSKQGNASFAPGNTVFLDIVRFDGPTSYATGGFSLATVLDSVIGAGRQIIGVLGLKTNGYLLQYDQANNKVKVFHFDYDAAGDGAAIEVPNTTDLSASLASAEMLVLSA